MTNATEIVLQIFKQKSQRVLFSGIVVAFVLEFVNVMQGSQGIYSKKVKTSPSVPKIREGVPPSPQNGIFSVLLSHLAQ